MKSKEEKKIIGMLSKDLQAELFLDANEKIIKNIKIISDNFSKNSIKKLSFIIEELQLPPNEIIFKQNDHDDKSLYLR